MDLKEAVKSFAPLVLFTGKSPTLNELQKAAVAYEFLSQLIKDQDVPAAPGADRPLTVADGVMPLTNRQIRDCMAVYDPLDLYRFARAIEQAHGIGVKSPVGA